VTDRPPAATRARCARLAACALLALWLGSGCTVRAVRSLSGSGDFAATPAGPSAVLRVTAKPSFNPRTGQTVWGLINTPNVEDRFAEFLADSAAREGNMDVLPPLEVERRLRAAGLEPTLQPDDEQLRQFADALGCASYLTARIVRSRLEYRLFLSWSTLEYTVTCYAPGREEPLWQASVCRKAPGKSDRQTMALALAEMFQWLRAGAPPEWEPECLE